MPDEDSVTLGMELPLTSLARAFEAATPVTGPGPRFHVAEATIEARGQRVAAELTLAADLCGGVALQAEPVFAGEEGIIELTAGKLDAGESSRVRAAGLDPVRLARQLTQLPRVETPLSLPMLRVAPPALAALFSDPSFAQRARVVDARGRRYRTRREPRGVGRSPRQSPARAEVGNGLGHKHQRPLAGVCKRSLDGEARGGEAPTPRRSWLLTASPP